MYFETMTTLLRYFCLVVCFVAIRVEGRGTWNVSGNYEYYASNSDIHGSYDDGLGFCQDNDGELALVKTPDIQSFLEQLVTDDGAWPYAFFIGLQDFSGTFVWDDGESLNYTNWDDNEPSMGGETCVAAGKSFSYNAELRWNDVTCTAGQPTGYFCQRLIGQHWGEWGDWSNCVCPGQQQRTRDCTDTGRPGPHSCRISGESTTENATCWSAECNVTTPVVTTTARPLGRGDWFAHDNFEYYVSAATDGVSYEESQRICKEEKHGDELALVKSANVQAFIVSLVANNSGAPYAFYVGLRYDVASGEFLWTDGTSLEYKNWKTGEPNGILDGEECVGIGQKYEYEPGLLWNDYQCVSDGGHGKKGLVCQRRIGIYWSPWNEWSGCSCATTNHTRNRTCVDSGRTGPDDCLGAANETQQCAYEPSCHTTKVAETTTAYPTTTVKETTTKPGETTSVTTIATEKPTTIESEATIIVTEETTTIALIDTTTAGEETTIAAAVETTATTKETTPVLADTTTVTEETTMATAVETTTVLAKTTTVTEGTTTMAKETTTSLAETTIPAAVTANPVVVVNTAMTDNNTTSTVQAPTTMVKETTIALAETTIIAEVTTVSASVDTTTIAEVTTADVAVEITTMSERTTTITEKITTTPAATVVGEATVATLGDTSAASVDGSGVVFATTNLQETLTSTEILSKEETTTPQTPETTPAPTTAGFEVTEITTDGASGVETTLSSKTTTKSPASSTAPYTTANIPFSTTNSPPEVVTTAETFPNATETAGVPISTATSPPLSTTAMDGQVHSSLPESPATTKIVGVPPSPAPQTSIVGPIVGAIGGCLLLAIITVIIIFMKHRKNRTGQARIATAPQLEMGRRGSDRQSLTHDNRYGVDMDSPDGIEGVWYGQGQSNSTFAYQEEGDNANFWDETAPFRADDEPGPSSEVTYAMINMNTSATDSKQDEEEAENSISRHIEVNGDPYAVVGRTKKDANDIDTNDDTDANQSEVTYAVVNKNKSAIDSKPEEQDHIEVNGDPYAVVDRTKKDITPSESVEHIDTNGDTYAVVKKSASTTNPEPQGEDNADPYSVI